LADTSRCSSDMARDAPSPLQAGAGGVAAGDRAMMRRCPIDA
jgi:hypothetical protein